MNEWLYDWLYEWIINFNKNHYEIETDSAAVGRDGGDGGAGFLQGNERRTAGKDAGRMGKHGQQAALYPFGKERAVPGDGDEEKPFGEYPDGNVPRAGNGRVSVHRNGAGGDADLRQGNRPHTPVARRGI